MMVQSRHVEVADYCQLASKQYPRSSFVARSCHAIVFKETLHFRCQQVDSMYVGERTQQWNEVVDDCTIQTWKGGTHVAKCFAFTCLQILTLETKSALSE